uniref:Uncharacterized protein n=1 Tax=Arundo donax TaxID=35708 RepID=A0A0A8ZM62_ARUDO
MLWRVLQPSCALLLGSANQKPPPQPNNTIRLINQQK